MHIENILASERESETLEKIKFLLYWNLNNINNNEKENKNSFT